MNCNRSLLKRIALHLSLMAAVVVSFIFLFFQFIMPVLTHHGEAIAVPSLTGISLEEADALLGQRKLHFAITDEADYLPEYPPMTVLQQHPKGGAYVKAGRKIYLTINSKTPPEVAMPSLVDGSVRNAKALLTNKGLLLGEVKYIPDIAQNAVLAQQYQGKELNPGTLVGKGSKIDLVVGAGLGRKRVAIPTVIGMKLEEAALVLLDRGIKVGNFVYDKDSTEEEPGTVLQQAPAAGEQVRIGEAIDLWLVAWPE